MAKYKVTPDQVRSFREHIVWQQEVLPFITSQMESIKTRLLNAKLDEVERLQASYQAYNNVIVIVNNMCKKQEETSETEESN